MIESTGLLGIHTPKLLHSTILEWKHKALDDATRNLFEYLRPLLLLHYAIYEEIVWVFSHQWVQPRQTSYEMLDGKELLDRERVRAGRSELQGDQQEGEVQQLPQQQSHGRNETTEEVR